MEHFELFELNFFNFHFCTAISQDVNFNFYPTPSTEGVESTRGNFVPPSSLFFLSPPFPSPSFSSSTNQISSFSQYSLLLRGPNISLLFPRLHSPNIYLLLIRGQNIFLLRIFFSFSFFVFLLLNGKNIFLLQISLFLLFLLFSERSSKILTRSTCNLCFFNFQFFRRAVGWWARFRGSEFICVFFLHF